MKNLALLAVFAVATVSLVIGSQLTGTASAHGILDQENDATGGGSTTIDPWEPIGQSFTPSQATIVGADVGLFGANQQGDASITLRVRDATIDGTILGAVTQVVSELPQDSEEWVHFDLPTPVTLVPSQTYVLELDSDNATHGWVRGGDTYSGGASIAGGQVGTEDFSFRTYSQDTPTPTPSPEPTPSPTPSPEPTATPTPTPGAPEAAAPAGELPTTGGAPSDSSGSVIPWLAAVTGAMAVVSAGAFWLAYQRRRIH